MSGMILRGQILLGPITLRDVTTSVGPKRNAIKARGPPLSFEELKTATSGGVNDKKPTMMSLCRMITGVGLSSVYKP